MGWAHPVLSVGHQKRPPSAQLGSSGTSFLVQTQTFLNLMQTSASPQTKFCSSFFLSLLFLFFCTRIVPADPPTLLYVTGLSISLQNFTHVSVLKSKLKGRVLS